MKLLVIIFVLSFKVSAFEINDNIEVVQPKNLIGNYLRELVIDSSQAPYRIIGKVNTNCTGTLIGPKHILTAAHCLYDTENRRWRPTTDFIPGMTSSDDAPFGKAKLKRIHMLESYKISGAREYDYAVVELDRNLGTELGWANIKTHSERKGTDAVTIIGYPGDKEYGTMWSVSCPAKYSKKSIKHKCNTYGGMSGSSIMTTDSNGDFVITAIHTDGGKLENFGVKITPAVYRDIQNWVNIDLVRDAVANFYQYCVEGNVHMVKVALDSREIFINGRFGKYSRTALAAASNAGQAEVVELLLSQPFVQVNKGEPLVLATKAGHTDVVKLLLSSKKLDINSIRSGETALWYAVKAESIEIVELLLSHPKTDLNKKGRSGTTPLELATKLGLDEILNIF